MNLKIQENFSMQKFKFLTKKKPVFRFESLTSAYGTPAYMIGVETLTSTRSELFRRWASKIFFDGSTEFVKYFPEIDRNCKILEYGLITSESIVPTFEVKIRVERNPIEYTDFTIQYPTTEIEYL